MPGKVFCIENDGSSFCTSHTAFDSLANGLKVTFLSTIIARTVFGWAGVSVIIVPTTEIALFRKMLWLTFKCRLTFRLFPVLVVFIVSLLHLIHCLSVSFILHCFHANSCRFI